MSQTSSDQTPIRRSNGSPVVIVVMLLMVVLPVAWFYFRETSQQISQEREFYRFKAYERSKPDTFTSAWHVEDSYVTGWLPEGAIVQFDKGFAITDWPSRFPLTAVSFSGKTLEPGDLQSLAAIANLEKLDLTDCTISDEATESLPPLKNLQTIWLVNARITPSAFGRLAKAYGPTVKVLSLYNSSINDEHAESFPLFVELRAIQLQYTALTEESARYIIALPKLKVVSLSHNGDLALYGLHEFEQHKPNLFVDQLPLR